jgi:hypothetical protein
MFGPASPGAAMFGVLLGREFSNRRRGRFG